MAIYRVQPKILIQTGKLNDIYNRKPCQNNRRRKMKTREISIVSKEQCTLLTVEPFLLFTFLDYNDCKESNPLKWGDITIVFPN